MPPRLPPPRVLRLRPSTLAATPRNPIQHHVRHHNHSSLDPSEVQHFNELAAEWWDPHGSSRLLHLMNPLRLRFIESCLRSSRTNTTAALDDSSVPASAAAARTASNLRYLDVGCGGGILAESLARLKTTESVVAIDPTPGVLEVAKTHMRQDPALVGKLEYRAATIEALRDEELFDVVTTMEVVEHVNNPYHFLASCLAHVRPGGWLVGSTIARTATSYLTTKLIAEDLLRIVPRGTHDWRKYINAEELSGFFAEREECVDAGRFLGCMYVPGLGWKEVKGAEKVGNYFFGVRRKL